MTPLKILQREQNRTHFVHFLFTSSGGKCIRRTNLGRLQLFGTSNELDASDKTAIMHHLRRWMLAFTILSKPRVAVMMD